MNPARVISRLNSFTRSLNTSSVNKRTFEEFKKLQWQMQLDESVPVYIRKGTPDRLLFSGVLLGLIVGAGMSAEFLYSTIWPKKNH